MIQLRITKVQEIIKKKITVVQVARELAVTRKTVHQWLSRYNKRWEQWLYPKKPWPKHWSPLNRTPKRIERLVIDISKEQRFKWPITIGDTLEDKYNIKLHPTTIFRILKRNHVRYNEKYIRFKRPCKLYSLWKPWQEMQLDTSFPLWYGEWVIVYDMIDDCSRTIKARAYQEKTVANSIAFVEYVLSRITFTIRAIRTDNWVEFSRKFSEYLESIGIKHIKNNTYTPEENWKIERYHRTRKDEDINYRSYGMTLDEANYRLKLWEYYYNHKRKHRGLGMNGLTPIQKYHLCSFIKV
jgi:hypothetical protein